MNNQEILDKAPEGATHIEEKTNTYIKVLPSELHGFFDDWFIYDGEEWVINDSYNILLMRSLADIKRIAELEEENQVYKQQWHELNDSIEHQLKKSDAIRNLEQQAKGVEALAYSMLFRGHLENTLDRYEVLDRAKALREQAKRLKDQPNV